jgi:hypothetical protein
MPFENGAAPGDTLFVNAAAAYDVDEGFTMGIVGMPCRLLAMTLVQSVL